MQPDPLFHHDLWKGRGSVRKSLAVVVEHGLRNTQNDDELHDLPGIEGPAEGDLQPRPGHRNGGYCQPQFVARLNNAGRSRTHNVIQHPVEECLEILLLFLRDYRRNIGIDRLWRTQLHGTGGLP